MIGYKIMAMALRKTAAEEPGANVQDLEAKARLYDFLGGLTEKDIAFLFDSGAFNEIAKGYITMLVDGWQDISEEKKDAARAELSGLFDEVNAAQALAYYKSH